MNRKGNDFPERVSFRAADGRVLSAGVMRPKGAPQAALLLGHAMMTNARSLDRPLGRGFASHLAARGFLCFLLDVRGHGQSSPKASRHVDWSYDDIVLFDLPAAVEFIKGHHPQVPLAIVGHSLVGHTSLALLGIRPDTPVDALVAVSSNVWIRCCEPSALQWARKKLFLALMGVVTTVFGYFPSTSIGMGNEDEASTYILQFKRFADTGCWCSADGKFNYRQSVRNIRVPVLALSGKGDTYMCRPDCLRLFHEPLNKSLLTMWLAGKGSHSLDYNPDHMEIITDIRSRPIWDDIADWLEQTLSKGRE
jgi:predicted alpha/beta hydrolase